MSVVYPKVLKRGNELLQADPVATQQSNKDCFIEVYTSHSNTVGDTQPIQLNQGTEDAVPKIKFTRYNNDSPEQLLVFFDEQSRELHDWLKYTVLSRIQDEILQHGGSLMTEYGREWGKKSKEQKMGIIETKLRGLFLPPREENEFQVAKFTVHPRANFVTTEDEHISKNEFKARYVECDEAKDYGHQLIVDIQRVVYTKQKNLNIKAQVLAVKAVYAPDRQQETEYFDEIPEPRFMFSVGEPEAKKRLSMTEADPKAFETPSPKKQKTDEEPL